MGDIKRDLSLGDTGVEILKNLLESFGIICTKPVGKVPGYDLIIEHASQEKKIEVKYDLYSARSGNIAIEYFNPKSQKPSGLTITESDFWCIVLPCGSVYLNTVDQLLEFIARNTAKATKDFVGDGNASIMLYDKEVILPTFVKLNDISQEKLIGFLFHEDIHFTDNHNS